MPKQTDDHPETLDLPEPEQAPPEPPAETYLGDGLYASDDGFAITLRAPRGDGDHHVVLEPRVLDAFLRWLKGRHR